MQVGDYAGSAGAADEVVTTVHVGGLPYDVTEREIYLLVVMLPGFDHGMVKYDTVKSPQAFVKFDCPDNAMAAVTRLNGMTFGEDQSAGTVLHASMASSQGRFQKREGVYISSNREKGSRSASQSGSSAAYTASSAAAYDPSRYASYTAGYAGYSPYGVAAGAYGQVPSMGGRMAGGGGAAGGGGGGGGGPGEPTTTLYAVARDDAVFHESALQEIFAPYRPQKITVRESKAWVRFGSRQEAESAMGLSMIEQPLLGGKRISLSFARSNSRA